VNSFSTVLKAAFGREPAARGSLRFAVLAGSTASHQLRGDSHRRTARSSIATTTAGTLR
jgi:hypothetical protein